MEATQEAESAQAEMMWVWLIWVSGQGGGVGGGQAQQQAGPCESRRTANVRRNAARSTARCQVALQHASAFPLPPHTHTHTPGSQPLKCLTWQQDAEASELGVADAPVSIGIKQRHHALSLLGRNAEAQHSGGTPHLPSIQPLIPVGIYRAENALQTRLLGLYVAAAGRRGGGGELAA